MATPFTVNQSTTLVQIDTSVIPPEGYYIVHLSTLNTPGSIITIRDITGNASPANKIIISTTKDIRYLDGGGPNCNIYTINQPYGFLSVTPKTPEIWGVLNTFAFPEESATAKVNSLIATSITVKKSYLDSALISTALISTAHISTLSTDSLSILSNLSVGQSTIAHAGYFVCTIRSLENIIAGGTVYAGSTISSVFGNITSTLTVPYISTQNINIYGVIRSASTIATAGPLFVGSSISTSGNLTVTGSTIIQGELNVQKNVTFQSNLSTLFSLGVGRDTQLFSSLTVKDNILTHAHLSTLSNANIGGALSVMKTAFFTGAVSTQSNLTVGGALSVMSSFYSYGDALLNSSLNVRGSVSTLSNVYIASTLTVGGRLTVYGDISIIGSNTILKDLSVSRDLFVNNMISTQSSIVAGQFLRVMGSTFLMGPVSTLSNVGVGGSISVMGGLTVALPTALSGTLGVTGATTLSNTLGVTGATTLSNTLDVTGITTLSSNLIAASTLQVGGATTLSNTLNVSQITTLASTLRVAHATTLSNTLGVTGITTLSSNLIAASTLQVGGATTLSNTLNVSQITTLASTLQVAHATTLSNTLGVIGITTLSSNLIAASTLQVGGATTLSNTLNVSQITTLASTLRVAHATTLSNTLEVANKTTLSNTLTITAGGANITGDTYIYANTLNNRLLTVKGGIIVTNETDPSFQNRFSNDTYMSSLKTSSITVYSFQSTLGQMAIFSSLQVQGSVSVFSSIAVSCNMYVGNTLDVNGNVGLNARPSQLYNTIVGGSSAFLQPMIGFGGITVPGLYSKVTTFVGSGTPLLSFTAPNDVAFAPDGTMYVVNKNAHTIFKVTTAGLVTTFAGSGTATYAEGQGALASFNSPSAITVGSDGTVYVADASNSKIRKITVGGLVSTFVTDPNSYTPKSIVIDSIGNVFYSTTNYGYMIRKVTPGGAITTFAGSGATGFTDGTASAASFILPAGLGIDSQDNIYVADTNAIRKITPTGVVTTIAGSTTTGSSTDGTGAGATFANAKGICFDLEGNLYVTDTNLIRKIVISTKVVTTFAGSTVGSGDGALLSAQFNNPNGIKMDLTGNLFVADSSSNLIRSIANTPLLITNLTDGSVTIPRLNASTLTTSNLTITGFTSLSSNLNVTGTTTLANTLGVAQATTLSNTLQVVGATTLSNTLQVVGATTLSNTLNVTGTTTLSNTLGVTRTTNLLSNLNVTGITTLSSNLNVTGITTLSSNLTVGKTLGVTGTTALSNTLNVKKVVSYDAMFTSNLSGTLQLELVGDATPARLYLGSGYTGGQAGASIIQSSDSTYPMNLHLNPLGGNVVIGQATFTERIAPNALYVSGTSKFNANVGILSDTNSYALNVNGTVFASNIMAISTTLQSNLYVPTIYNSSLRTSSILASTLTVYTIAVSNLSASNLNIPSVLLLGTETRYILGANANGSIVKTNDYGTTYTSATQNILTSLTSLDTDGKIIVAGGAGSAASGRPIAYSYDALTWTQVGTSETAATTFVGSGVDGSTDAQGILASFRVPSDIVFDKYGTMYIADTSNNKIRKVTSDGAVTTFAGSGTAGSAGGQGIAATFNGPIGIAVHTDGTFYVIDTNNTIRKITSGGLVSTFVTDTVLINGIVIHSNGNVFYSTADFKIKQVILADISGVLTTTTTTFAGSGVSGYLDESGTSARFIEPRGLTIDASNNIYVADKYAIRQITPAGVVTTVAGSGTGGTVTNGTGAVATFTNAKSVFNDLSGNLYVSDDNLIRKIVISTKGVTTFAGSTSGFLDGPVTSAQFTSPLGIKKNSVGNLFISDSGNNRIREIKIYIPTSTQVEVFAIASSNASSTANLSAIDSSNAAITSAASASAAKGSALTANTYANSNYDAAVIASNAVVNAAANAGKYSQVLTFVGGGGISGNVNGTGTAARFNTPYDLAFASDGKMYVADYFNNAIRTVDSSGTVATFIIKDPSGNTVTIFKPVGITVGSDGTIYVVNLENLYNRIRKITPQGAISNFLEFNAIFGQTFPLWGVVVDSTGNVFNTYSTNSSDNTGKIEKRTSAGVGVTFTSFNFTRPRGLTIDEANNIYVADRYFIRKITPQGSVTTIAGFYDSNTSTSIDGIGTAAGFKEAIGICYDLQGYLYVTDFNCIRKIAITTNPDSTTTYTVTTLAGSSAVAGYGDATSPPLTSARFYNPYGIRIDSKGSLFIADSINNCIRKIQNSNEADAAEVSRTATISVNAADDANTKAYNASIDASTAATDANITSTKATIAATDATDAYSKASITATYANDANDATVKAAAKTAVADAATAATAAAAAAATAAAAADTAKTSANTAKTSADTANTTAATSATAAAATTGTNTPTVANTTTAKTAAAIAYTKADLANTDSINAKSLINTAKTKASSAETPVNTAKTKATDAVTAVSAALKTTNTSIADLLWNGKEFVVVGNAFETSPDGITWTGIQLPSSPSQAPTTMTAVGWNGYYYIIASATKLYAYNPVAPATMTEISTRFTSINKVFWTGSVWLIGGAGSYTLVSYNGTFITPVAYATKVSGIASDGKTIVAVGGNTVSYSTDGISWLQATTPSGATSIDDILWDGANFVAFFSGGTKMAKSLNGIDWIVATTTNANNFYRGLSYRYSAVLKGANYGLFATDSISTTGFVTIGDYLRVGQSTLVVQDSTRNMGINCNAPSYPLDVNGIINAKFIYQNGAPYRSPPITVAPMIVIAGLLNLTTTPRLYTGTSPTTMTLNTSFAGSPTQFNYPFYTGSNWYLGATSATTSLLYSSTDAKSWELVTLSTNFPNSAVNYIVSNGSDYLICGTDSNSSTRSIVQTKDFKSFTASSSGAFTNECRGAAWNGTLWVAVGQDTAQSIKYSYDGKIWNPTLNAFTVRGYFVVWNGNLFVACGADSVCNIKYSYDGIVWYNAKGISASTTSPIINVVWSGKRFVAIQYIVSSTKSIFYSDDGINWSISDQQIAYASSLVWTGSQFIVGTSISSPNLYVSEDGVYWTPLTPSPTYDATLVMNAIGYSFNTAPDLTIANTNFYGKQQPQTLGSASSTNTVLCMSNALLINSLYTDTSGKVGVNCDAPQVALEVNGFAKFNNSLTPSVWVLIGYNNSVFNFYASVNNGVTWTVAYTTAVRAAVSSWGACWNGKKWLIMSSVSSTTSVYTSSTGFDWSIVDSITGLTDLTEVKKLIWTGTYYIAVGKANTTNIVRSLDGKTWTGVSVGFNATGFGSGIAYNGRMLVATGSDTTIAARIKYSTDHGLSWTNASGATIGSTSSDGLAGRTVCTNGKIWLVGYDGGIVYSYNGINYSLATTMTNCYGICWNGKVFVAVGQDTTANIRYSYDGISWTNAIATYFTGKGVSVSWNGSLFIAIGGSNTTVYKSSSDGINWTDSTTAGGPGGLSTDINFSSNVVPDFQVENLGIYGKGQPPLITSTNTIALGPSTMVLNNVLNIDSTGFIGVNGKLNVNNGVIISAGDILVFFAGSGTLGYTDGTGINASFGQPVGVLIGNDGTTLYVFDTASVSNRIRNIDAFGNVTTYAGKGGAWNTISNGTLIHTKLNVNFNSAFNGTFDPSGNLYVCDTYNHMIRRIDASGNVTTIAGSVGVSGFVDATGTSAKFNYPQYIAYYNGDLYVADKQNHAFRKISTSSSPPYTVTTFAGASPNSSGAGTAGTLDETGTNARFNLASSIYFSSMDGCFYIVDSSRILKMTTSAVVTTIAVVNTTTSGYRLAYGIVQDSLGNLYTCDVLDGSVKKITKSGSVSIVTSSINSPYGIAIDKYDNLFISSSTSNKIFKISAGNIGIGTTPPVYASDVTGNINVSGTLKITGNKIGLGVNSITPTMVIDNNIPNALFTGRDDDIDRTWNCVASSSDGTNLVAVVYEGFIYTSADSGVTWISRDSNRNWYSVASSSDGKKLVAVVRNGQIYTSTDSGFTWVERTGAGSRIWTSVASSSDGTNLVAVVQNGQIYISTTSGVTWESRDSNRIWTSVASSYDGKKLVAGVYGSYIYISTDSGFTWTPRDSIRIWQCVASSSDGVKLVALAYEGFIYTSADSGVTWTSRDSIRNWQCVASSYDGTKLVAGVFGGYIYISTDSGVTWTPRDSIRYWRSVALSSDGLKVVAVVQRGKIYRSYIVIYNTLEKMTVNGSIKSYQNGSSNSDGRSSGEGFDNLVLRSPIMPLPNSGGVASMVFAGGSQNFCYGRIYGYDTTSGGGVWNGNLSFQTTSNGSLYDRMTITNDGNVGIGVTTPSSQLHVATDIYCGRDASFAGNGAGTVRVGPDDNIYTAILRVNGKVGIGLATTTTPSCALDVSGYIQITGSVTADTALVCGNAANVGGALYGYNGISAVAINMPNGANISNTLKVTGVTTLSNTLQVTGVTTLSNTLQVTGVTTLSNVLLAKGSSNFSYTGYLYGTTGPVNKNTGFTNESICIRGSQFILSDSGFIASSDERIKKNIEPVTDALDIVNKLELVSYDYIDFINQGTQKIKHGLIAQTVQKVYPEAVTITSGYIPSVYKPAASYEADVSGGIVTITTTDPHNFSVKDKIRIYINHDTADGEYNTAVLDVPSDTTFTIKAWDNFVLGKDIFIYGKEVNDFLAIDKPLIGLIAAGACKTLSQQVSSLQQENLVLRSTINAILQKYPI